MAHCAASGEQERLLDAMEDYYVKATYSERYPMEGEAIVSLSAIDEWCHAYAGSHLLEAQDYLDSVGIKLSKSDSPRVSFVDALTLSRKLWAYVSSYMSGGHDRLFEHAELYLMRAEEERIRSKQWIEQRQRGLGQLLALEKQFIALANINASLPANAADVHLAVVEEMLLDANDKTAYDIDHKDGNYIEVIQLISLLERELKMAALSIKGFGQKKIANAASGNSLIDTEYVDFSVLEGLGIQLGTEDRLDS